MPKTNILFLAYTFRSQRRAKAKSNATDETNKQYSM